MTLKDKITVLYVDDEFINLDIFEMTFRNTYNVITAESGFEGLKVLNENPDIKIVISDMKMPEMNGIEFITKAKQTFTNLVFLILTGFDINDEIKDSLNNGLIEGYFQKPFNRNLINEKIKSSIN